MPTHRFTHSVLLVDHPVSADSTRLALGLHGICTHVCPWPDDAIQLALATRADVLMIDPAVRRGCIDGFALARAVRAHKQLCRAWLIALGVSPTLDAEQTALAAGFDHYWTKPADPERLAELVRQVRAPVLH